MSPWDFYRQDEGLKDDLKKEFPDNLVRRSPQSGFRIYELEELNLDDPRTTMLPDDLQNELRREAQKRRRKGIDKP